jgi:hypothetical protein
VYLASSYSLQAKLLPSNGKAGDNFGFAVSCSGNTIVTSSVDPNAIGTNHTARATPTIN